MANIMFTTVTLRNCISGDNSKPLVLAITPSYPAPAYFSVDRSRQVPRSWTRQKRPTVEGSLEVTLLHRIAEGRIGVVYLAGVDQATRDGVDVSSSIPKTLCLKFAKQHHCRSLAREAWFYEQLHKWHGISIPDYYGFFTSTMDEQGLKKDTFEPWTNLRTPSKIDPTFRKNPELAKKYRSLDWLPDDAPGMLESFTPSKYRARARWFKWNLNKDNPHIGVTIMENLGQTCAKVWLPDDPGDAFKADLLGVLDDVAADGLNHADVTSWNFLQYDGPETDERRCPRHGVVHKWRLIDFDRSCMLNMADVGLNGEYVQSVDKESVGDPYSFWGYVDIDDDD